MKLTCKRGDFYDALQTVIRAVSGRSTLPILSNVLIEPSDGTVTLAATDLELGIRASCPAAVEDAIPITLPAKTLGEIVGSLPDGELSLEVDAHNSGVIRLKRSRFQILGLVAEEFPTFPTVQPDCAFEVSERELARMIRSTVFATSTDDTRPVLTAVHVSLEGNQLRMAATDTHRLAVRTCEVNNQGQGGTCLIPARAFSELLRSLRADAADSVQVAFDQNQVQFTTNGVVVVSRLIEGTFPRFERVIPARWTRALSVPVADFLAAVKRAAIVARENANRLCLTTKVASGLLHVTAQAGDLGEAEEEVEATFVMQDDTSLVVNFKFVADVLAIKEGETMRLEMTEPLAPIVLRPEENSVWFVVVMPMQVN